MQYFAITEDYKIANLEHKSVVDPDIHEPKDISTAASGTTYVANGSGSGTWKGITPANTVIVNALSDFPAPSGGKITLAANTNYVIGASITTADAFTVSDGVNITANNLITPTLTYSGTGTMFTGVDAHFTIDHIELDCPSAQVFDMSETGAGGTKIFQADTIGVISCTKWGTYNKLKSNLIVNSNCLSATTGVELLGSVSLITSFRQFALVSTSTTFVGIDFGTSVQQTVELVDLVMVGGAGSIGIKGAAANANITANFIADVSSGSFANVTTPLSGITVDDFRWSFDANGGIQDTQADGMLSLTNNTTATVIAAVDTPVLIAGTHVVERSSHFTGTTAGRLTYNGERDLVTPVDVSIVLDPAAGTNQDLRTYIALNGSVITNSGKTVRVDAGSPEGISLLWQLKLSTNDFIEVFVENKTSTNNITAQDCILRIR